jgi:Pyruvate/2-oxoacid:ferredoxin oxidoreductase delta subunit
MRYHEELTDVLRRGGDGRSLQNTLPGASESRATGRVVKKIPPELRRKRIRYSLEPLWYRRVLWRLKQDSQFLRSTVQFSFVLLCVWIGIEFHEFVQWGMSGGTGEYAGRPPGVEGFLPISALMSLKYWWGTGIINDVHPSGLFIFLGIVTVSVLLKKAFCSWFCPIGTLSESLWMLGQKLFKRNLSIPRWLDYPLRSIKYLLLLFFVWSIWQMTSGDLAAFIYSPYNKMADVKMYQFFAELSSFALGTLVVLVLLSLAIKNFWCRFLCPYGALLGIAGWFSPLKITRNQRTCIDCELCTKACPAAIKVHKVGRVRSDECTSCLACVEVCPVRSTLDVRVTQNSRPIPGWVLGTLVTGVFVAITGLALLAGHWHNQIGKEEYQRRFQQLDTPIYQHNRGQVPRYGPND